MNANPRVESVPAQDAAKRLASAKPGEFVLLDCRDAKELVIVRIAGATHIPMAEIPARLNELDPEAEIVVFCHHGARSQKVAAFLLQQDFGDVKSLRGGIDAWAAEVDPRLARY